MPVLPPPGNIRRIRLLWIGRLGDILVTTPLFAALRARFPQAHISLVAGEAGAAGAGLCAELDEVRILRRFYHPRSNLSLAFSLLSEPADLLIDLNTAPSRSSILLAGLSRAKTKIAFSRGAGDGLFTRLIAAAAESEPMMDRYGRLAAALEAPYEPRWRVRVPEAARGAARAELAALKNTAAEKWVLLHPGNFKKSENRWPEDKFAALAERLSALAGIRVAFLAGPGEDAEVGAIAARLSRPAPVLGRRDIAQTAALLAEAALVVVNATGTAHLAVAAGARVFALVSRYSATVWMPKPGYPRYDCVMAPSWESCREIEVEEAWSGLRRALQSAGLARE